MSWCFFACEEGYIGLAPQGGKAGDQVCIVLMVLDTEIANILLQWAVYCDSRMLHP